MFTGIVQGTAVVDRIDDVAGLRRLRLDFGDPAALSGAHVGASIAVDGVCLTVTSVEGRSAAFDAMQQTLGLTTLGAWRVGQRVNVERAARADAEIGGHPLSGHVDAQGRVAELRRPDDNNHVLRIEVPAPWMRYLFAKGYVAVDGASLTIAQAQRHADGSGWFEVWLIPETLRVTTFGERREGDAVNLEIDRATQVVVDTVRDAVAERLGALAPTIERLLAERGLALDGHVIDRGADA